MKRKEAQNAKGSMEKFFSGAAVIGMSVIIVKIIGLFYKIPLMNCLGADGMGYFNSAYEIYLFFCIIATAGMPVAMSALISKSRAEGNIEKINSIYRTAITTFTILGLCGSCIMLFGADALAAFIENSAARRCIAALSPSVFLIFITSALRGYFQGHEDMTPTAVSQIIEALGKLILGLMFALIAQKKGCDLPDCAAYAVLGLTLGTAASTVYLALKKRMVTKKYEQGCTTTSCCSGKKETLTAKKTIKELLKIAVPVTLSAAILSITRLFDTLLIMRRLQTIGYSESVANAMYGSYTTLAVPISNLPPSLIMGIALSLVPMLTKARESNNKTEEKRFLVDSLKMTSLFAIPAAFGIAAYSTQILMLIYGNHAKAISIAAPLLSVLGISVFFSCMITTTNAILQAYNKAVKPMVSMMAGAAVKIIFGYILIGIPQIGIMGAPLSTLMCNITALLINFYFIYRYAERPKGVVEKMLRILSGSFVAIGLSMLINMLFSMFFSIIPFFVQTLLSMGAAAVTYILLLPSMGILEAEEIKLMPAGSKILKFYLKLGLIKYKEKNDKKSYDIKNNTLHKDREQTKKVNAPIKKKGIV